MCELLQKVTYICAEEGEALLQGEVFLVSLTEIEKSALQAAAF